MGVRVSHLLFLSILGAGAATAVCGIAFSRASGKPLQPSSTPQISAIKIDYPLEGSLFPPEITPPTFLWHDANENATRWVIEVSFAGAAPGIQVASQGDQLQRGEIDPGAGPGIALTAEQATTHTWKPDAATWAKIKRLSGNAPAHYRIRDFADRRLASADLRRPCVPVDITGSRWRSDLLSRRSAAVCLRRKKRDPSRRFHAPPFLLSSGRFAISRSRRATW